MQFILGLFSGIFVCAAGFVVLCVYAYKNSKQVRK